VTTPLNGIYLWGAQLEVGSNATSYIPTLASAVTRNADLISKTGISDLIGQSEGTFYLEFNSGKNDLTNYLFSLTDGTINNRISIYKSASDKISSQIRVGGVIQAISDTFSSIENTIYKCAVVYSNNYFAFYVNGIQVTTDFSVNIPNCNTIISNLGDGSLGFNRNVNLIQLYKTALSDAELIQLTTL
jgi:hypothetical protein